MNMFCYQCQEASKGVGCDMVKGICGIPADVVKLQDLEIYLLKGLAILQNDAENYNLRNYKTDIFITDTLFKTVSNVSFSRDDALTTIKEGLKLRDNLISEIASVGYKIQTNVHDSITWFSENEKEIETKAESVNGKIDAPDEDVRSLRSLVLYGIKGMAAYHHHAIALGFVSEEIFKFTSKALEALTNDSLRIEENIELVMETGKYAVDVMALLDKANTESYGNPEITEVNLGVRNNPGILISGHDLKDIDDLLKQTEGTGVDVYTHSEMLPAHYYPKFKKYDHFVGNYGNAWWQQDKEFTSFNGPIIMTTNCIIPVKEEYKNRIYTTGVVSYPEVKHITQGENGEKDFSEIIELAKKCKPPIELESGKIIGGFAHNQVMQLADKIVSAVKSGAVKKFVVMAGCDGRQNSRNYYTEVAQELPNDSIILTAGCAKYRYNKLELGNIDGIPRVLDAGQCNDSYSLAVIALKLKEVFGLEDINDLPIAYDIAWYEQKAVTVLLALLYLGVKGIRLGPTLPAFLSPNVAKVLVENFDIKPIGTVKADVEAIMS